MSNLRKRIAAEQQQDQNNVQPSEVQDQVQPTVQDPNQVEQPVQEAPVEETPVQEAPAQDEQENKEDNKSGVLADYGDDYTNQWGKVTPYHILFKDLGDEISRQTKDQAVDTCLRTISELSEKYNGDPDYTNPSPEAQAKFRNAINKGTRNGMDVLFKVKDFLLASEGMAVMSTLEDALKNPKVAKRVAGVFNALIAAHEKSKKK